MNTGRNIPRRSGWKLAQAVFAALLALTVVGIVRAGGPPWKTKPFEQWTQKDVKEILGNSPWTKVEYVPAPWKPGGSGAVSPEAGPAPVMGAAPTMGRGSAGTAGASQGAAGGPADAGEQPMGTPQGQATYYIRWNSSLTVHEALVRDAILNGKMKESDAGKYLSAPITDYELLVLGPDMTPFQHATPDELKAKSSLRGKQSKVDVNATNVNMVRSPNGGRLTAVVFTFPRKTAAGKDVAAAREKGLQFECKLKDLDLRSTFDTRKMVDQKGPDF
ncbi:MAG TPA: hypothetical protein VNE63_12635 [Candidatus Acidoferrales bacterium]|nr:hypothetical protein [Candidatus Acidoferrales bacterium]